MKACCRSILRVCSNSGFGLELKDPSLQEDPAVERWLEACAAKIKVELITATEDQLAALAVGHRCPICGSPFSESRQA